MQSGSFTLQLRSLVFFFFFFLMQPPVPSVTLASPRSWTPRSKSAGASRVKRTASSQVRSAHVHKFNSKQSGESEKLLFFFKSLFVRALSNKTNLKRWWWDETTAAWPHLLRSAHGSYSNICCLFYLSHAPPSTRAKYRTCSCCSETTLVRKY